MTELKTLTEQQFNDLKKSGLLKVIYPDAPETHKEIKGLKPKPIENPDFTSLKELCESYLNGIENGNNYKDTEHYIFETALGTLYGEGVWDFVNSFER